MAILEVVLVGPSFYHKVSDVCYGRVSSFLPIGETKPSHRRKIGVALLVLVSSLEIFPVSDTDRKKKLGGRQVEAFVSSFTTRRGGKK